MHGSMCKMNSNNKTVIDAHIILAFDSGYFIYPTPYIDVDVCISWSKVENTCGIWSTRTFIHLHTHTHQVKVVRAT